MTTGFIAAQMSRANASALRVFELLDTPIELASGSRLPLPVGRVRHEYLHMRPRRGRRVA